MLLDLVVASGHVSLDPALRLFSNFKFYPMAETRYLGRYPTERRPQSQHPISSWMTIFTSFIDTSIHEHDTYSDSVGMVIKFDEVSQHERI